MPSNSLPIQNINNAYLGVLIGQGNSGSNSYPTFAIGVNCCSVGPVSYAEGQYTSAVGSNSHAEGGSTSAVGSNSHAEGGSTSAVGSNSHAEGGGTNAIGQQAHSEGAGTLASGNQSHAEGGGTNAIGDYSHAEGIATIAGDNCMHAGGRWNSTSSNAAFVIGNGTDITARSDAFIVDWNGKASATSFENSAGEIPALIPTASQPAGSVVCTIYSGTDGKYYIVS